MGLFIPPRTIQTLALFPPCLLYLPTLFVPQPALPQPTSFSFFKNLSEPGIAGRDGGPGRVKTICIDQRHGREGECYVEMVCFDIVYAQNNTGYIATSWAV